MELVLESIEVWEGGSANHASHGVADESDAGELITGAVFADVLKNLLT